MTSNDPTPVLAADSAAVARYEQLRRHVLGEVRDADGAPGLVLLMRRGMCACVDATGEPASAMVTPTRAAEGAPLEDGLRGEIVRVMVAMALGAAAEKEVRA